MLAVVHIRELVQFAAYMGCLLLVAAVRREFRPLLKPSAMLFALTVAIAGVYTLWHGQTATLVGTVVADQRSRLEGIVQASSWRDLLFSPAPAILSEFVLNADQVYEGITPLLLWSGPAILVLFPRQPLAWMACVATAVYLAVMTVPLFAIPYIYVTYFEILFTPVRNVMFFVYLFAGAIVYAGFAALTRWDRTRLSAPVVGVIAGALALAVALCVNHTASGFMVPLIAAYAAAVLLAWQPSALPPMARRAMMAVLLLVGLVTLFPERDPPVRVTDVSVRWSAGLGDEQRQRLERQFSLERGEPNSNRTDALDVWNYELRDASAENVRALVTHPSVADTGGIERSTFTVAPQSPQSDHPYLGVTYAPPLQYPGMAWFVAAALFLWTLGFVAPVLLASARGRSLVVALNAEADAPLYRQAAPFALMLVPLALWPARPTLSPLYAPDWPAAASTPSSMLASMPCMKTERRPAPFSEDLLEGEAVMLPEGTACPPGGGVVTWVRENIPVDAVFAINRWNPYLPTVFMPQQVVVYPQVEVTFEDEHELFGSYYRYYDERMRTRRVQPFFNSVETSAERAAFVQGMGVTHVLVDPAYFEEMRAVLDRLPEQFALRYREGEWAVYEVVRPQPKV
jgi:hypothetical protein